MDVNFLAVSMSILFWVLRFAMRAGQEMGKSGKSVKVREFAARGSRLDNR